MDSRIGLDFIVENPEYIRKLAAALDTKNVTVKKQVFELLSALCVYNEEGHARVLDTLDHYKNLKGERYRLTFVVKELDLATILDYQTALVAFINCLIISISRLNDRTRLRNEFIGCHLLPVLNNLRKCAEAEPELAVQLDVFDEQRDSDDAQNMQGPHGVDLNSPLDVFYAILKQVADTPQEIPYLSILQHLLRIDPKEAISDVIWDTAERLVHRATLLENRDDAMRLLRSPSVQNKLHCHCQQLHRSDSSIRRPSLIAPVCPVSPPPPPPPVPNLPPPPPPPPNIPPPAPMPPPAPKSTVLKTMETDASVVIQKLPQQETPVPKIKMKTINWNKIPSNKLVGNNNVWTQLACNHQNSPMADMDWSEMEGLFCQQGPPAQSSGAAGRDTNPIDTIERRMRKESPEITLLDGKRSLNVNIFLKQFRSSNEDIIQLIKDGQHDDIGAEKLKGLLKILPEIDELDMLKSFNGDFSKLGNAEKFLLQLTSLSNYKLRIEGMLLKEEFASNMGYLEPSINSMIVAAEDLMTNKPLQEVLYMILVAGNFLNSGGYAGNAAGVKLSSLQKITDIRANKPNMNLIHFVALQAEKRKKSLLSFSENVNVLEDAAKNTVDQLHNEINALYVRIKKIQKQITQLGTEMDILHQMADFLQMAEREVTNLLKEMGELENVRKRLADFFCEDVNCFKLEECFRIFHSFYSKFRQAVGENERRRIQEEQANARRRQREELLATKRRQMESLGKGPDAVYVDTQIYDSRTGFQSKGKDRRSNGSVINSEEEISIQGSPSVTRRRLGSFNGQNGDGNINKDDRSPDITPTGSLRRRRSRVLSEEDEGNLMDFLRTSGHDSSRERKSWGSLDRSWARRVRGGSGRKRPTLLGADFGQERERPASPSPLSESKPIVSSEGGEEDSSGGGGGRPREWRQKIENWLQSNDTDQGSDENRQSRKKANRKSLEVDSESDRSNTLDTLPEGKQVYSGSQSTYRRAYPDWKPSTALDKTDVVSTMEVVEEVQPQLKDKSAWRKSNLNVANSSEEMKEDSMRNRPSLQCITEVKDRKELINSLGTKPTMEKLTVYIRKPSETPPPPESLIASSDADVISNKVEIDQDNIETPPTTRKTFSPPEKREPVQPSPCRRLMGRTVDDPEPTPTLGDGQFDRFSAARRTRRYKRSIENSDNETIPESQTTSSSNGREPRVQNWQDRLKTVEGGTMSRRLRNQTGINHEEVKMALSQPIAIEKRRSVTYIEPPNRRSKEHENDEGFEETQSLMSESPSQGASSGGNFETDSSREFIKPTEKPKATTAGKTQSMVQKYTKLDRSASMRHEKKTPVPQPPKRAPSLRKTDSQNSIPRRHPVQRSSSRNSIVSSRSSLNSASSVNTIKNTPLRLQNITKISNSAKGTAKAVAPLKRTPSITSARPPRPTASASSFMKPTTASSTKTSAAVIPTKLQSFRTGRL